MTEYEDDLALAKRLSLVMDSDADRCHASSSAAPHHPLKRLLKELTQNRLHYEELDEEGKLLDAGIVALQLQEWAADVRSTLIDCNAAEKQRSVDLLKDIDWYNDNIDAANGIVVSSYRQGKTDRDGELLPEFEARLKAKVDELKQSHAEALARARNEAVTGSIHAVQGTPTRIKTRAPAHQHTRNPAPPLPLPIDTTPAHDAQAAFWKRKYDSLADRAAALRTAKVEEPSIQGLILEEVDKVKKQYELQIDHHKARAEKLADMNAELRKQLRPLEKRKADDEVEDVVDVEMEMGSPKRSRSDEGFR